MPITLADMGNILMRAGYRYRKHENDYIRHEGGGRFHIKPTKNNSAVLHYDNIVNGRHWAPYMPLTYKHEWERIKSIKIIYEKESIKEKSSKEDGSKTADAR